MGQLLSKYWKSRMIARSLAWPGDILRPFTTENWTGAAVHERVRYMNHMTLEIRGGAWDHPGREEEGQGKNPGGPADEEESEEW